jgi:AcrR family transcriptional regulator
MHSESDTRYVAGVEGGLREQKKERTREAIAAAALDLFTRNGFEQTTIADIAAAADIAPRTFFGYFPSKEHVLFGDFDEDHASLAASLAEREPGVATLDALRAWVAQMIESKEHDEEFRRCRQTLIQDNEQLAAHERELMGNFERTLAESYATDFDASPDDLRPQIVAAGTVAALMSLKPDPDAAKPANAEEALAVLDEALDFVRGGIARLEKS